MSRPDDLHLEPLAPAPGAASSTAPDAAWAYRSGPEPRCPRCHYLRKDTDTAPAWQCPSCGVAYNKARAATPKDGEDAEDKPAPATTVRRPKKVPAHTPPPALELPAITPLRVVGGLTLVLVLGLVGWQWQVRQAAREATQRAALDARAAQVAAVQAEQQQSDYLNNLLTQWRRNPNDNDVAQARQQAEKGDPRAMVVLAQMLIGTTRSHNDTPTPPVAEAIQWLERAAQAGNALAAVHLGHLYENGQAVLRQYGQAENWYRRAALQGNGYGQFALARLYERGPDPIGPRPTAAYFLLVLAVREHENAPQTDALMPSNLSPFWASGLKRQLEAKLSREDKADAQRRADAWQPGQPLGI